jgi:protein TonB
MGGVIGLLFLGSAVAGHGKRSGPMHVNTDVILESVKEPDVTPPVLPPPPKPQPQVATLRMTTTVVPDNKVPPNEKPPENDDANDRVIGFSRWFGGLEKVPRQESARAG